LVVKVGGALLGAWLSSLTGRKGAVLLSALPALIGWVIIAIAQNLPMLYIGR
jgi:facilitated trehalose transporter